MPKNQRLERSENKRSRTPLRTVNSVAIKAVKLMKEAKKMSKSLSST